MLEGSLLFKNLSQDLTDPHPNTTFVLGCPPKHLMVKTLLLKIPQALDIECREVKLVCGSFIPIQYSGFHSTGSKHITKGEKLPLVLPGCESCELQ